MNPVPPLEAMERRTYIGRHDDGLLDLILGLGLAMIGAAWLTDEAWAGAIVPALLVPIWYQLKKSITAPRAGTFNALESRRVLERRKYLGLVLLGLVALTIGVALYLRAGLDAPGDRMQLLVPALPGVLLAVGAGISAVIFGVRRFLIYAGVLIVAAIATVRQQLEPGLYMLEVGVFVTIVGAVMLFSFMRKHPVPDLGDHA